MQDEIKNRKKKHIEVCLDQDVAYKKSSGFENYDFIHNALPEISFDQINTKTKFLGKDLSFPLIISGITGGSDLSFEINKNLAIAAQECGVALGLGSSRAAIENPDLRKTFQIRKYAKTIPILANLGAVQLNYGYGLAECKMAVELAEADALVLHLNPIQEVLQNGDTNFGQLLEKIEKIISELGCPVIIKEVGFGISADVGKKLESVGAYAIDVAGAGGTSWAAVESFCSKEHTELAKLFWNWGISTSECIKMNKDLGIKIIAGGGIKTGIDIAKAIALGADYPSIAGPLLKPALEAPEKLIEKIQQLKLELKTTMFGIGAGDVDQLKNNNRLAKY